MIKKLSKKLSKRIDKLFMDYEFLKFYNFFGVISLLCYIGIAEQIGGFQLGIFTLAFFIYFIVVILTLCYPIICTMGAIFGLTRDKDMCMDGLQLHSGLITIGFGSVLIGSLYTIILTLIK